MFAKRPAESVKLMPQSSSSLRTLRIVLVSAVMIGCSFLLGYVLKRAHEKHLLHRDITLFLSILARWKQDPSIAQKSPIQISFSDTPSGRFMAYYATEIEANRLAANDILIRKKGFFEEIGNQDYKVAGRDWFYSAEERCEAIRADEQNLIRRTAEMLAKGRAFPIDDSLLKSFKQGLEKPASVKKRELQHLVLLQTTYLCEAICALHARYEAGEEEAELNSYTRRQEQIDEQAAALSKEIQELERQDPLTETLLKAHEYEKSHKSAFWLKGWLY